MNNLEAARIMMSGGGGGGQSLFQTILTLPTIGSFTITDNYTFIFKCGYISSAPNITTGGDSTIGAYVTAKYFNKPDLWLVLSKNGTPLMATFYNVANQAGWSHSLIYVYDSNLGVYLKYDDIMDGSPTMYLEYMPSQGTVGALNLRGQISWQVNRTEYDGQGGSQQTTFTGGIGIVWYSVPGALNMNTTDLTNTQMLSYLDEFAQECETRRQQL